LVAVAVDSHDGNGDLSLIEPRIGHLQFNDRGLAHVPLMDDVVAKGSLLNY
jgi:hypothetical protein